jgi:hypothetical protein
MRFPKFWVKSVIDAKDPRTGKEMGSFACWGWSDGSREEAEEQGPGTGVGRRRDDREVPTWFGVLGKKARRVPRHDMEAIRGSIAAGISRERDP